MTIPINSDRPTAADYSQKNNSLANKNNAAVLKTERVTEIKQPHETLTRAESAIQISPEAKYLNSCIQALSASSEASETVDWNKVNKIKEQIESGSYAFDYEKIATKLVDFENNIK